jgi:beta-lactam-binding protein with PASTA domain
VALSVGVAVALLVVATLATGAGVQAYRRLTGTGHVVPQLVGLSLAQAESVATGVDLRVVVAGHRYDGTIAVGDVVTQSLQRGANEQGGTAVRVVLSLGAAPVPVPDLTGDNAAQAQAALTSGHLAYATAASQYSETVQSGLAIQWAPAGSDVHPGTTVTVTFSLGPKPRNVPALRDDTWAGAQSALEALRLVPVEQLSYSTSVPKGEVIGTYPPAEQSVPRGSSVTVDVSKGPQYVTVPEDLVGQSAQQAAAELTGEGLVVLGTYGVGSSVIYSVPAPGTSVQVGTGVTLYTI